MCVSDSSLCPNPTNGCPWNKPIFCNYAATCVTDATQCPNEDIAKAALTTTCAVNYSLNAFGCPRGDCATSPEACAPYTDSCWDKMYPNTVKVSKENLNENFCYIP
jgi:hypothetical protein